MLRTTPPAWFGAALHAVTVNTVAAAVAFSEAQCGTATPVTAGVDTLLQWSDGPSGSRPADLWLRKNYPKSAMSVASANSLYGAMAVGGMALALWLRQRLPSIQLNETHPQVLIPALGGERYSDANPEAAMAWFAGRAGRDMSNVKSGHELDALLSALTTRTTLTERWPHLVQNQQSLLFPAGYVTYFWANLLAKGSP